MCEYVLTNILWLEKIWRKDEVYKDERNQNLAFSLVIFVRIPPNFLYKSRVLHLVCTPTGVYSGKGSPRSSCFLLFYSILISTIMNGDGNYACVLLRNFYFKELIECNTEKGQKKNFGSLIDLIWRFWTRRNLFVFPLIGKEVFVGRFTQTKFTVSFHLYLSNTKCRTAHHSQLINPF